MTLKFYKYQGTGNDFVILDNRTQNLQLNTKQIAFLCDRRFGIGADGLMLLENADGFDFKMVYYNSDGNESTMCGNGGRCLVKFAYHMGVFTQNTTFIAVDGPHEAFVAANGWVHLKMIDVQKVEKGADYYFLNTGSPHHVQFVADIENHPIVAEGRTIRYSEKYAANKGTNVNFAQLQGDTLFVRTYERGVEDETYSCGTGVTAAAIAALQHGATSPVSIKTLGGNLSVSYTKAPDYSYTNVFLNGPAEKVFEGNIEI
ncbi:MAG: diaminopimelate epimerase [Cytophagales bacterium]